MSLINNRDAWRQEYRKDKTKIWIIVHFQHCVYYFADYEDWYEIKKLGPKLGPIQEIKLQYRSHIVSTGKVRQCEGVYLVRSIIGKIGGEPIKTITVGLIKGDKVHKTCWSLPDLTQRESTVDNIEDCFKEAMVLWR